MKLKISLRPLLLGALAIGRAHAASGPFALWHADGNADDSAGTNNGALFNGTAFFQGIAPGSTGQAFDFDGGDDEVHFPNPSLPIVTDGLTVVGWMRTTGTADFSGLVVKFSQVGSNSGFQVVMSGNNGFPGNRRGILRADFGTGTAYSVVVNPKQVDDGIPHHFAATCDGQSATIYVDGEPGPSAVLSGWIPNNADIITLGNDAGVDGRHFHGQLDEIAIYQRVLDAQEIAALAGKPVLQIVPGPAGQAIVSWPAAVVGFHLQVNETLAANGWIDVPSGAENPTTVSTDNGAHWYRLANP